MQHSILPPKAPMKNILFPTPWVVGSRVTNADPYPPWSMCISIDKWDQAPGTSGIIWIFQ